MRWLLPLVSSGPERLNWPNLERKLCALSDVCSGSALVEWELRDKMWLSSMWGIVFGDFPMLIFLSLSRLCLPCRLPPVSSFSMPIPSSSKVSLQPLMWQVSLDLISLLTGTSPPRPQHSLPTLSALSSLGRWFPFLAFCSLLFASFSFLLFLW